MSYGLWVTLGVLLAFIAMKRQPRERTDLTPEQQHAVLMAAILGAVGGAYLFEIPADMFGWFWRPDWVPADVLPLGGRTVLGGLLGSWITVEVVKWCFGITGATGDRFALPLALAMACGRLGCASAGCCGGLPCDEAWWTWHGHYPVQFIEAIFHASAAMFLALAATRRIAVGRRLAIYVTSYALLRFALEWWRGNPPILWGLTWYQILALALVVLAGGTWIQRARVARSRSAALRANACAVSSAEEQTSARG